MKMRILTTTILCFVALSLKATIYTFGTFQNIGVANPTPTFTAMYDDQYGLLPNMNGYANEYVKNYIKIELDYSFPQQINTTFHHKYTIGYTYWDATKMPHNGTAVLYLSYNPNAGVQVLDKDAFYFQDGHGINITSVAITDVNTGVAVNPLAPAWDFEVKLSYGIEIQRYYDLPYGSVLCPAGAPNDIDGDGKDDELVISWVPPVPNYAESYDLEYTFVDDYTATSGSYKALSQIQYDFKHNSTRVSLKDITYTINLLFEHGYVLYRIRPVGRDQNNIDRPVYGDWSMIDLGTDPSIGGSCPGIYHVVNPHEGNLNWQYGITFAEEGKHKEIISYFDGSSRNRQDVTRVNTDNEIVVGESFYDYHGRKAISVLPVPIASGNKVIQYYENFNLNSSHQKFTKEDFDLDALSSCDVSQESMSVQSGASKYYSTNNGFTQPFTSNLPDAQGYPYSQIEYTPDPTGRVRRSGSVGPDHQLDSDHEKKYYYGQPTQVELDRLFGSEVGYNHHYKKNMVIDPNGQITISYLDLDGRVIATALTGDAPVNVQSLTSGAGSPTMVTADLFAKDGAGKSLVNRVNQDEDALVFNSYYLVSNAGSHTFDYEVTPEDFTDACLQENSLCYDCVYDLEITVIDECQAVLYQNTETIGTVTIGVCPGASTPTPKNFILALDEGNYQIVKKLTVNKAAYLLYVQDYLNQLNSCVLSYSDILNDEYARIDLKDCREDCDECLESLGSLDEYLLNERGTEADWRVDYENCLRNCTYSDVCETGLKAMLSDMSPGGQYAEWNFEESLNLSKFPLSILNPDNYLPSGFIGATPYAPGWKNPKYFDGQNYVDGYYDKNGNRVKIPVVRFPDGTYFPEVDCPDNNGDGIPDCIVDNKIYPEDLKNVEDFILFFDRYWAYSLILYHPEYEYYQWCVEELASRKDTNQYASGEFDQLVLSTESYSDAAGYGFISSGDPSALLDHDPFFNGTGAGASYKTEMAAKISVFHNGLSMADVASAAALCPKWFGNNLPGTCYDFGGAGLTSAQKDLQWQQFAYYYNATKQEYVRRKAESYVNSNSPRKTNGCIGNTDFHPGYAGYNFRTFFEDASGAVPCSWFRYKLYRNKTARMFFTYPLEVDENLSDADYQFYATTGICPNAKSLFEVVNEVVEDGNLFATTFSMTTVDAYDFNVYSMITGIDNHTSNNVEVEWTTSSTSTDPTLVVDFSNPSSIGLNCNQIKMTMPSGLSYDWDDLVRFRVDLLTFDYALGSVNYGEIQAEFDDDSDPLTPPVLQPVSIETCLDIFSCQFEQFCPASEYNIDLVTFLNALVDPSIGNFDLNSSTPVNVYTSGTPNAYDNWLGEEIHSVVKNNIGGGTPYSSLDWVWDDANSTFKLYVPGAIPAQELYIEILGYSDATFNHTKLGQIQYFKNFRVDDLNKEYGFYIEAWYLDGSGVLQMVEIHGGVSEGVLTNCTSPGYMFCQGHEYDAGEALEELIYDVAINNKTYLSTMGNTLDITSFDPYENVLVADLGVGTAIVENFNATSNEITFDINVTDGGVQNICTVQLNFTAATYEGLFDFSDLTYIKDIRMDFNRLIGDNSYYFFLTGTFNDNGIISTIDIEGHTECIPIKSCTCDGSGSGGGGGGGGATDTCTNGYGLIRDAMAQYNNDYFGNNPNTFTLDHTKLDTGDYNCDCAEDYVEYLKNYTEVDTPAMSFTAFQLVNCEPCEDFDQLIAGIDAYNNLNPTHTIPYPSGNDDMDCDCVQGYVDYLGSFKTDIVTADSYEEFAAGSDSCDPVTYLFPGDSCNPAIFFSQILVPKQNEYNNAGYTGVGNQINIPYPTPAPSCDCINKYHSYLTKFMLTRGASQEAGQEYQVEPVPFDVFVAQGCTEPQNCYQEYNTMYMVALYTLSAGTFNSLKPNLKFDPSYDCNCFTAYLQYILATGGQVTMSLDDYCNTTNGYWTLGGTLSMSMIAPEEGYSEQSPDQHYQTYVVNGGDIGPTDGKPKDAKAVYSDGYTGSDIHLKEAQSGGTEMTDRAPGVEYENQTDNKSAEPDGRIQRQTVSGTGTTGGSSTNLPGDMFVEMSSIPSPQMGNYVKIGTQMEELSYGKPCFSMDLVEFPEIVISYNCNNELRIMAEANAKERYRQLQLQLTKAFRDGYYETCLKAQEDFTVNHPVKDYHYTLYYYDQAGNLVRTVPPEGVVPITNQAELDQIVQDRTYPEEEKLQYTTHYLSTRYTYNSLDQLVYQRIPDHERMELWEVIDNSTGLDANTNILQIEFEDELYGYLIGKSTSTGNYKIYRTEDGGKSWSNYNFLDNESAIETELFTGDVGYALFEGNVLFKTTDNGANWKLIKFDVDETTEKTAMAFGSATEGMIGGNDIGLEYTNDGGNSWSTINLPAGRTCIDLTASGSTFYILADNGGTTEVYTSNSGSAAGLTNIGANLTSLGLTSSAIASANVRYVGGDNGVWLKTSNGGTSWTLNVLPVAEDIIQMFFKDDNNGLLLTDGGRMYKTSNGGTTWTAAATASQYNAFSIYDAANGKGFAVGDGGRIARIDLSSSGKELTAIYHDAVEEDLEAVSFLDAGHGFVYSSGGKLYEIMHANTKPGTIASWTIGTAFSEMSFNSATKGVALGTDKNLYVLTNSGGTFSAALATGGGTADYYDIVEAGSNIYAVRDDGAKAILTTAVSGTYSFSNVSGGSGPASSAGARALDATGSADIVVAGTSGSKHKFTGSWTDHTILGSPQMNYTTLAMEGSNIVVGAEDGFWMYSANGTAWNQLPRVETSDFATVDVTGSNAYGNGEAGEFVDVTIATYATAINALPQSETVNHIEAVSSSDIWIGLEDGSLFNYDGSSANLEYKLNSGVTSISAYSGNIIASTANGEVHYTDGVSAYAAGDWLLPAISEMDCRDGFGVVGGDDGLLLLKSAGTMKWEIQQQLVNGTSVTPSGVYAHTDRALIGGPGGLVMERIYGGSEMSYSIPGASAIIDFARDRNGYYYALESGNNVYQTSAPNNLSGWTTFHSAGGTITLSDMDISGDVAFIVGDQHYFARIDDILTSPTPSTPTLSIDFSSTDFVAVKMYDMVRAYVIGTGGILGKTKDDGVTWEKRSINGYLGDLNAIAISNRNNIVFGANANHLRRIDDQADEISTRYWYDRLGRMVISQNTRQFESSTMAYGYTTYDALGRIAEAGRLESSQAVNELYSGAQLSDNLTTTWLNNGSKSEVTETYYDDAFVSGGILAQENTRNRVTSITLEASYDGNPSTYDNALHYSYDIHGNVSEMVIEIPELVMIGQDVKHVRYEYDQVSGNVNYVHYQEGEEDQYHYRYEYDADNRIRHAYSSKDGMEWENDAAYFYYPHGALARVELGEEKVQGIDYAYTLHGWLKGINSTTVTPDRDMGQDGLMTSPNSGIARDAYSFSLGYYENDFVSINGLPTANNWLAETDPLSGLMQARNDLWNGNISHMVTSLSDVPGNPASFVEQAAAYQYDQLNRLVGMETFVNIDRITNSWQSSGNRNEFKTEYGYDEMGNVKTLKRSSGAGGLYDMDDITYIYPEVNVMGSNQLKNNRLAYVTDIAPSGTSTNDIEDQSAYASSYNPDDESTWNYDYDQIGNLIADQSEEILNIEWTTQQRIKSIERTAASTKPNLEFTYDPAGNRLTKKVIPNNGDPVVVYYYVRDAKGNEISRYEWHENIPPHLMPSPCTGMMAGQAFVRSEVPLYGRKRLGIHYTNDTLLIQDDQGNPLPPPCDSLGTVYLHRRVGGTKSYELTNHIGNALTVITDRSIGVDYNVDGTRDYWVADIIQVSDYYPFGMVMDERSYISATRNYRFGFNDNEKDDEVKGSGNSLDFGARIYDSRLARFLSIDPWAKKYPWQSTYAYFQNSPIWIVDAFGLGDSTRIPDGAKLTPENNEQNKQVGVDEVISKTKEIIEGDWVDDSWEDIKMTETKPESEGGHSSAVTTLKGNAKAAFNGEERTFSGELHDPIDDDDVQITYEVVIISVDEELQEPGIPSSMTTSSSTGNGQSLSTSSSTSGNASVSGNLSKKPKLNGTVGAGVSSGTSATASSSTGDQTSVAQVPGVYRVTYVVKITVMYDADSACFSGSTGETKTFYTEQGTGLLTSPTKVYVTKDEQSTSQGGSGN